jgi:ATP-dependent RNA helicase DHX8/PRP22
LHTGDRIATLPSDLGSHALLQVIATGQVVKIHPSSVLCGKKVECVLFNELLHTSKCYIRECTAIEPRWLPELAPAFFAAKVSTPLSRITAPTHT